MVLGHVSMAQPTMAQSAVALPATNYCAQQLYFKRMIYGQDRQCGTACDGTACNVAQPAMAESAMWVRPEGTWPAPRAQKMLGLLASCRWPSRLDHWRSLPVQLIAYVNDLFLRPVPLRCRSRAAATELQQQGCSWFLRRHVEGLLCDKEARPEGCSR